MAAKSITRKRLPLPWLVGLLVALVVLVPLLRPPSYLLSLMFFVFMYIALAESWNIIGRAGYLSFGHVAFFGIGAYTTALLLKHFNQSPFLTAPLGGVLAGVVGCLVGYPCLRLRGPYFGIVTLLFAFVIQILALNSDFVGGATGLWLKWLPADIETNRAIFYEVMLVLAALCTLAAWGVERSKLGIGLLCIREDEDVAQTIGINAPRLKILAFSISAFFTAIVGAVYGYYLSYINAEIVFSLNISLLILLMALFGGNRTWGGPFLGAVVLSLLNEFLTTFLGAEIARIFYGSLFILVMFFMPNGAIEHLGGLFAKLRPSQTKV